MPDELTRIFYLRAGSRFNVPSTRTGHRLARQSVVAIISIGPGLLGVRRVISACLVGIWRAPVFAAESAWSSS